MSAGSRFLPKPQRFLHQFNTEFSRHPRTAIPACRLSSTTSKTPLAEEAQTENWRCRVDLAASYRILGKYNLHEGVYNHLSMMAPATNGDGELMSVIPYGLHWLTHTRSAPLIKISRHILGSEEFKAKAKQAQEIEIFRNRLSTRLNVIIVFFYSDSYLLVLKVKASSFVGLNVKREVVEERVKQTQRPLQFTWEFLELDQMLFVPSTYIHHTARLQVCFQIVIDFS